VGTTIPAIGRVLGTMCGPVGVLGLRILHVSQREGGGECCACQALQYLLHQYKHVLWNTRAANDTVARAMMRAQAAARTQVADGHMM
jgi:hypothetical protein